MKKEIWKDINEYEGVYMISSLGRVKRMQGFVKNRRSNGLKPIKEKILKNKKNIYFSVALSYKGVIRDKYIHRLVAEAFLDEDKKRRHVNHKNGKKHDNRIENLEWSTPSENLKHSYSIGTHKNWITSGKTNPNYKHGKCCRVNKERKCIFCKKIFIARIVKHKSCSRKCTILFAANKKLNH